MNQLTTLQQALLTIKKLKQLVDIQNKNLNEPIAIIGMSCRFAEADSKEAYWELLSQHKNVISSFPEKRWELLKQTSDYELRNKEQIFGSFLDNITDFDAYFFGISPREAMLMDPQQRLLLEVAYEAIEDAGLSVEKLSGSNTGVFSALYPSQFAYLQELENDADALYLPTGNAVSMAANRISYLFDLRGPSIVLDTACSSSLVAVHLACLNLQANLCDLALVAAANINLLPSIPSVLAKAKMLSPEGQCKTFSANADGYVQGEGVGVLALKSLSKAIKDQDRIYAVIAGSAMNQDGKTNGLTAPNGLQQEKLIKSVLQMANIDPEHISYVECHGTGTFLGDPIELQALGNVVGKNRSKDKPCWIGSVKTNIGHLEPAAGMASIIKVALALKNRKIPAHLNFNVPNPHIQFDKFHFQIPLKMEEFPQYGKQRLAGISGFGFGGTNAHIILREFSAEEQPDLPKRVEQNSEIFTLSAKDRNALHALIDKWCQFLENNPTINLSQLCYNTHVRRSHYPYRIAIVTHSIPDLHFQLSKLQETFDVNSPTIFINMNPTKNKQGYTLEEITHLDLPHLAKLYVNHAPIDWFKYEKERIFPHLDMPFYAWQHKTYWPVLKSTSQKENSTLYPLQGKYLNSPLKTRQFDFSFDTKVLPEVADTFHVVHAGFYIEMLAFAVNTYFQQTHFSAKNIEFLSPLLVLPDTRVQVQLLIEPIENDYFIFHFYSLNQHNWIEHARGKLSLAMSETKKDLIHYTQPNSISLTEETFFSKIIEMGMPAGDSVRWTKQYWVHQNKILCQFREPKKSERGNQFYLKVHPGIIDGCVQSLFMLLPEPINKPYVASRMDKITYFNRMDSQLFLIGNLNTIEGNGEKFYGNWYLIDKNNQLIAECENICMTQLNNKMGIDKIIQINTQPIVDLSLPMDSRKQQIIEFLRKQIADIFSMPAHDIDIHQSLHDYGLDSLMALGIIRMIETGIGVSYSMQHIMLGPSIIEMTNHLLSEVSSAPASPQKQKKGNLWINYRKIPNNPKIRLFCFPYGGGGASIYREWQKDFSDSVEICPIQLPGRENRLDETPIDNLDVLVNLLIENLKHEFDLPFAFLGHSFGSLIGFELARQLRKNNLPLPRHLFASAYPDPKIPTRSLNNLMQQLSSININLFDLNETGIANLENHKLTSLSKIFSENGIVDYSGQRMDKEVIKVLLPIFIGDMKIVTSYQYKEETPLDFPITVFLGKRDTWVSYEDHMGWSEHTKYPCDFHLFDSTHLFIREDQHKKKITQLVYDLLKI